MPFQPGVQGRVFGEGVFENDSALHAVTHLNELAGLDKLQPTATATGDTITYSLYATQCSSPEAVERVRRHLDDFGVLHRLAAKMVANYFNPLRVQDYTCWGYVPVILGACAMSHGCRTLYTAPGYKMFFKTFKDVLIGIFEMAPLMDAAKEQMKKALNGPDGFKPGTPIEFARFARPATHSPCAEADACIGIMVGGVPAGYDSKYTHGEGAILNMVGPCSKEDMYYSSDKKLCGGCEMYHGKSLLCSRCKDQVYCSKACQRKDFGRHKIMCRTPEDRKVMLEEQPNSMWMNSFYVSEEVFSGPGGFGIPADLAAKVGQAGTAFAFGGHGSR